jgi:predicted O-methyltransferase YrrM
MNKISQQSMARWFTSKTEADQCRTGLKKVISRHPEWRTKRIPTQKELHKILFGCDSIFPNFKSPKPTPNVNYNAHISDKSLNFISEKIGKKPQFMVEVGSFIGHSARILAEYIKGVNGHVLCIDTWCGDINMWLLDEFNNHMLKQDGHPKLYDRFMHNIIDWDLTKNVTPLQVSSIVGARMLKVLNFSIDVIYLDSAHEAGETFMELCLYYELLNEGGVIFGDDFNLFPAVGKDVEEFCRAHDVNYFMLPDKDTWAIQKNNIFFTNK